MILLPPRTRRTRRTKRFETSASFASSAVFLAVVLALAVAQFALLRNTMPPPDAITYFDVADQISRVGYSKALPVHWAPLYPLSLLAARTLGSASLENELAVSAAVDGFALVVLCVVVVLVFRSAGRLCWPDDDGARRAWVSYAAGAAVFLAFAVLRVGLRMPDALATSLAVLMLWTWCQAFARRLDWRWGLLAGVVSGVAFLARANLMHWALVVAALACGLAPVASRKRRGLAFASFCVGLLVVVAPHTYLLSSERGHFTWGENGKIAFVVGYGATWPNGVSAWPARLSDGDVRIFTETHTVNFPGFYDPGREFEDAMVLFSWRKVAATMARASAWCLVGNHSASFALMWPLFWAFWPALVFGLNGWPRARELWREGIVDRRADDPVIRRRRIGALLILAGAAGFAMHLVTFCNGYYLPPYFIALSAGVCLAMLDSATAGDARHRQRAAHLVGIGFVIAATLMTARYARSSETRGREATLADARAMAAALSAFPPGEEGLRKIGVVGNWLGLYGVRLSGSQVLADIPDPAVLRDRARLQNALRALRERGVVALLVRTTALVGGAVLKAEPIGGGDWSIVDLTRGPAGLPDENSHS